MKLKIYDKSNNPLRLNNPQTSDYDNLYEKYFALQDGYKEIEKEMDKSKEENNRLREISEIQKKEIDICSYSFGEVNMMTDVKRIIGVQDKIKLMEKEIPSNVEIDDRKHGAKN